MRLDRSDVAPLLTILLGGAFSVVATGSMTLRTTDSQRVVVEVSAPEQTVRVESRVAPRPWSESLQALEEEIEALTVRPAMYVDGVLVERASDAGSAGYLGNIDADDIAFVTVLKGPDASSPIGDVMISLRQDR